MFYSCQGVSLLSKPAPTLEAIMKDSTSNKTPMKKLLSETNISGVI